jgi:hypothetical protein
MLFVHKALYNSKLGWLIDVLKYIPTKCALVLSVDDRRLFQLLYHLVNTVRLDFSVAD